MFIVEKNKIKYSLLHEFGKGDNIPEPKQDICSLPLFCDFYRVVP